jgi:hypothetical protein
VHQQLLLELPGSLLSIDRQLTVLPFSHGKSRMPLSENTPARGTSRTTPSATWLACKRTV